MGREATQFGAEDGPKSGRPVGALDKRPRASKPAVIRARLIQTGLSVGKVERELKRIALLDPLGAFERASHPDGSVRFRLKDVSEMPVEVRACIASIKVRVENVTAGDKHQDQTIEIRFWDKIKALELCAKHFGWVSNEKEFLVGKELLALLEAGRQRNAARRQVMTGQTVEATIVRSRPSTSVERALAAGPTPGVDETPVLSASGEDEDDALVI